MVVARGRLKARPGLEGFHLGRTQVSREIFEERNRGLVAFGKLRRARLKCPPAGTKKPRAANRRGWKIVNRDYLFGVVHLGCCRDFLELGQGTERFGFHLTGAAAGSGDEREGGHTDGSDNAEHDGSEVRFF
jgi:hypothetical protein